jgi:hypothetical protein
MMSPVVWLLFADRNGHGHLGHHRGAATPNQAAVGKYDPTTLIRCSDSGIHAGTASADHQHIRFEMDLIHCTRIEKPRETTTNLATAESG